MSAVYGLKLFSIQPVKPTLQVKLGDSRIGYPATTEKRAQIYFLRKTKLNTSLCLLKNVRYSALQISDCGRRVTAVTSMELSREER